jgi:hypothetical protein
LRGRVQERYEAVVPSAGGDLINRGLLGRAHVDPAPAVRARHVVGEVEDELLVVLDLGL